MSCNDGYPINFPGLDYTRFIDEHPFYPHPNMTGAVSGVLPLYDIYEISPMSAIGFGQVTGVSGDIPNIIFQDVELPPLDKGED